MIDQICLHDALLEGAKEVFETMVFMDIEESLETDQNIDNWALLGSITFKGGMEGCLSFCSNVSCAKTIASNMLGLDATKEPSEEDVCDAIGEIANMLMGSVKARILDKFESLEVSIPSVVSGRKLENNLGDGANKILVKLNIEDKHVAELSLLYRENTE